MSEALWLTLGGAAAAGFALGALHFQLLWWTTRNLHTSRRPHLRLALSTTVRMGGLLAGLALVTRLQAPALLAALVGVAGARAVVVRWIAPSRRESGELAA